MNGLAGLDCQLIVNLTVASGGFNKVYQIDSAAYRGELSKQDDVEGHEAVSVTSHCQVSAISLLPWRAAGRCHTCPYQ